ncbi:LmeA family phospholipid-binding protein [Nocardia sp. IFM 10818]
MRVVLGLIVVLAVALVVGDRVAVGMAEGEIGRRIAAEYSLPREPRVDIRGFPFLTQAVDGRYADVGIRVGEWSDERISVRDLEVTLNDVDAPLGDLLEKRTSSLVARMATATAVVPYETVQRFAPEGVESISHGADGLRVTGTFSVRGIPVPATVVVTVAPTGEGIEVTPVSVQPSSGGPTISLALVRESLTFVVPLQRLPLGAQVTDIRPATDGLQVTAVAHDVRFSDLP